ncbi:MULTISPECIES: glycosyltransferase family 2 protein [Oleiagrimonas]|jgi:glycosyltransferase involved in cell wall biosynthesis|uniref:Glycosyltransferase family 2 protein n=1 Tax=Oleiagrimonas citrea TaxID=1665687 RepID=A0A846ZR13_9GAMM|nr:MULTISPECIES: glycosyltransferase family 2 protein [Oleiagrimonas]NKZ39949.1 glycosyltransferase family 2 protein [Oleiagrimonas citrea]RAP56979.1 lipopolysaccharide core biosynthesis glycosyl transferase (KdtX) [Oleiagrimonas sp. MCCC 1A03011]
MAGREPLSVVVITYNNADTLDRCLREVDWVEDLVVLDSGSDDDTVAIARQHGARVETHPFDDYGPQKQRAIDMARHDWVLNLDADEILSPGTREVIERALVAPDVAGYRLPRRERMFWGVQHRHSHRNGHLRLFDRRRGGMNDVEVHAAVEVDGPVRTLREADFVNDGDADIATRVDKINRYSSGMVAHKLRRRQRFTGVRMVLYPPVFFLRQYLFKRYFLSGWAGFVASVTGAFYVFLKYAKLYEARRNARAHDDGQRRE